MLGGSLVWWKGQVLQTWYPIQAAHLTDCASRVSYLSARLFIQKVRVMISIPMMISI